MSDGSRLNLPNALSVLRLVLVPAFAVALLEGRHAAALWIFALAGITDALDGLAARRLQQQTTLGTYLDPLADKLLTVTAFVLLAGLGWLPVWLAALVASRDVVLLASPFVYLLLQREQLEVRVSWLGKANTVLQITTVVVALAHALPASPGILGDLLAGLVWATGASVIASGVHYLLRDRTRFRRIRSDDPSI